MHPLIPNNSFYCTHATDFVANDQTSEIETLFQKMVKDIFILI